MTESTPVNVKLDAHAAYWLLSSIFCFSEILQKTPEFCTHGDLLAVLARDAERRIAQVFCQINKMNQGIFVELPDCDESAAQWKSISNKCLTHTAKDCVESGVNAVETMIPENFDYSAAFDRAMKETLVPVGRLEMLKCKPHLTGKEVEELYGIPEGSLRTWRCRGGGPRYHQSNAKATVLYKHDDIKEFMTKNRIKG